MMPSASISRVTIPTADLMKKGLRPRFLVVLDEHGRFQPQT